MYVSIIIPSWNRLEHLKLVLRALEKQTDKNFEVIISDDGSTDGTKEYFADAKYKFEVKYVWNGEHTQTYKQCRARNNGVRNASEHSIAFLFLDSDILLPKDAVAKLKKCYEKNPNRVIAGMYDWGVPMKITEDDIVNRYQDIFDEKLPSIPDAQPHGMLGQDIRNESFMRTNPDELHWDRGTYLGCFGGLLFVPRHIFLDVAKFQQKMNPKFNKDDYCGYDEFYTAPVEDGDFGLSLEKCGWPVSLNKEIRGYHMWHPRNISEIQKLSAENIEYLNAKHKLNVQTETDIVHRQDWGIK